MSMKRPFGRHRIGTGRPASVALTAALAVSASGLMGVGPAMPAASASARAGSLPGSAALAARPSAVGTVLLNETFEGASAPDPNLIPLDNACLTGASSPPPSGASPLGPCASTKNAPSTGVKPGYLQLTDANTDRTGGVVYNRPLPANGGLVAEFETYQYGGTGADGISFFLSDGSSQLTHTGFAGGGLGYADGTTQDGVHNGYAGVGFDVYGNYNTSVAGIGQGCAGRPNENLVPNAVGLRGPGDGKTGYCYLAGTIPATGEASTLPGSLRGTSVNNAKRKVRVTVSPDKTPTVTVEIDFNDGKGYQKVLSHKMTEPVPPTYKFGFAASTGASTDVHLIRNISIRTVTPLSKLNLVKQIDNTTKQPEIYKVGETVPYQFVVTNAGAERVTGLTVTDPKVGSIKCPATTLQPAGEVGSTVVCTGSRVLADGDVTKAGTFTNTAAAAGKDSSSAKVTSNESSATVKVKPPKPVHPDKTPNKKKPHKKKPKVTFTG
jgi:Bacterial lectin